MDEAWGIKDYSLSFVFLTHFLIPLGVVIATEETRKGVMRALNKFTCLGVRGIY